MKQNYIYGKENMFSKISNNCNKRWSTLVSCAVTKKSRSRFDEQASKSLIGIDINSLSKIIKALPDHWYSVMNFFL